MIDNEVARVCELHIYEVFKFILSCARNEHVHESLNNLVKFPVSRYNLRSTARDEEWVPLSNTKKLDQALAKRVPALYNKFIRLGLLPETKTLQSFSDYELKNFRHKFFQLLHTWQLEAC